MCQIFFFVPNFGDFTKKTNMKLNGYDLVCVIQFYHSFVIFLFISGRKKNECLLEKKENAIGRWLLFSRYFFFLTRRNYNGRGKQNKFIV